MSLSGMNVLRLVVGVSLVRSGREGKRRWTLIDIRLKVGMSAFVHLMMGSRKRSLSPSIVLSRNRDMILMTVALGETARVVWVV